MPELIAKTALAGTAPFLVGGTTLAEVDLGPITSIARFPGKAAAVDAAFAPLGVSFPAPGAVSAHGPARLIWTSRDQAFLTGAPAPDMGGAAALTDQSGGWAALRLSGPLAEAALMRLVPLDLRLAAMPVGRVVRAPLNHMQMILLREGAEDFLILVFRSMARTAWHELEAPLRSLAARARRSTPRQPA